MSYSPHPPVGQSFAVSSKDVHTLGTAAPVFRVLRDSQGQWRLSGDRWSGFIVFIKDMTIEAVPPIFHVRIIETGNKFATAEIQ